MILAFFVTLSFSFLSLNARGLRQNVRKALFVFVKQQNTDFSFFKRHIQLWMMHSYGGLSGAMTFDYVMASERAAGTAIFKELL